jgi:hypothetical protein
VLFSKASVSTVCDIEVWDNYFCGFFYNILKTSALSTFLRTAHLYSPMFQVFQIDFCIISIFFNVQIFGVFKCVMAVIVLILIHLVKGLCREMIFKGPQLNQYLMGMCAMYMQ